MAEGGLLFRVFFKLVDATGTAEIDALALTNGEDFFVNFVAQDRTLCLS
jgi:hypothetical protein